jgi:hypothetical protein
VVDHVSAEHRCRNEHATRPQYAGAAAAREASCGRAQAGSSPQRRRQPSGEEAIGLPVQGNQDARARVYHRWGKTLGVETMAIIVRGAVLSHQPTGKLPVWLVDVEIDGACRSIHVTAPDTIKARKAVAERLGVPLRTS